MASENNYLDDLDNLLDQTATSETAQSETIVDSSTPPVSSADIQLTQEESAQAVTTWAKVIENASEALQEATHTVQSAAHKNIELAKLQQEGAKDLSDAASGWRHATRQAVQEVETTKKNIIFLTVISGLIALAGFGTTIGVMLDSRGSIAKMGNAILENVDEHQSVVSKTLTIKIDELASTIEQLEVNLTPHASDNKAETSTTTTNDANTDMSAAVIPTEALPAIQEAPPAPAPEKTSSSVTAPTAAQVPPESTAQHKDTVEATMPPIFVEQLQQITQQLQQLQQLQQNWQTSQNGLQQQINQLPQTLDDKLQANLSKLNNTNHTSTATNVTVDNKAVLEQLGKLRNELADIRQTQTQIKQQLIEINAARNTPTYQYRNPDVERYPR